MGTTCLRFEITGRHLVFTYSAGHPFQTRATMITCRLGGPSLRAMPGTGRGAYRPLPGGSRRADAAQSVSQAGRPGVEEAGGFRLVGNGEGETHGVRVAVRLCPGNRVRSRQGGRSADGAAPQTAVVAPGGGRAHTPASSHNAAPPGTATAPRRGAPGCYGTARYGTARQAPERAPPGCAEPSRAGPSRAGQGRAGQGDIQPGGTCQGGS